MYVCMYLGADVNCSSPIIGSPLHVACADNIPNRYEIMQMLLERGADPNQKVYSDSADRNSQLRPVLVEYLASNDKPSVHIVNLLLRYGARVCTYIYHQVTIHCYTSMCVYKLRICYRSL